MTDAQMDGQAVPVAELDTAMPTLDLSVIGAMEHQPLRLLEQPPRSPSSTSSFIVVMHDNQEQSYREHSTDQGSIDYSRTRNPKQATMLRACVCTSKHILNSIYP